MPRGLGLGLGLAPASCVRFDLDVAPTSPSSSSPSPWFLARSMERLSQLVFAALALTLLLVGSRDISTPSGLRLHPVACVLLHVLFLALLHASHALAFALAKSTASPAAWRTMDLGLGGMLLLLAVAFADAGGTRDATQNPLPTLRAGVFVLCLLAVDLLLPAKLHALACGFQAEASEAEASTETETSSEEDTTTTSTALRVLPYAQLLLSTALTIAAWVAATAPVENPHEFMVVNASSGGFGLVLAVTAVFAYAVMKGVRVWRLPQRVTAATDGLVVVLLGAYGVAGPHDAAKIGASHVAVIVALVDAAMFMSSTLLLLQTMRRTPSDPEAKPWRESTLSNVTDVTVLSSKEAEAQCPVAIAVAVDDADRPPCASFASLMTPPAQMKDDMTTTRMT